MSDLATPVLVTITAAAYGGGVERRIKKSMSGEDAIKDFMKRADYPSFVKRWLAEGIGYGTSYAQVGENRKGIPSLATLPPLDTEIETPEDDVNDVESIKVKYGSVKREFREDGVYERRGRQTKDRKIPDTDFGFIPVAIGRGRHLDASTPYGESLLWSAAQFSKMVTYLFNDLMVLEHAQSFSTLVIEGNLSKVPKEVRVTPFTVLRLASSTRGDGGKAYYIQPSAKISDIDSLADSMHQRCAVSSNVPVELFMGAKAGTQQSAQSALLTHKPLYDLVVELQDAWRDYETNLIAMIDAFLLWKKIGQPVDLDKVKANLEVEIVYYREANPAINQSDAQTYIMLLEAGIAPFESVYRHFYPDSADKDVAAQKLIWEETKQVSEIMPSIIDVPRADASKAEAA